jgi:hypothetical protein
MQKLANPNLLTSAKPQRLSMIAVIVVIAAILFEVLSDGLPNVMMWDLFGSHLYLPMVFDQHHLVFHDLEWMESVRGQYDISPTLYQVAQWENGNFATRNTCGWAILMLPFYLMAELWAAAGNYPTDGFSWPYQCMLASGSLIYAAAGFLLLRKVLLEFFSDRIAALTLLLLVFGTNLYFMQTESVGSTHNLAFFLISAMLYFTIRFHRKISRLNAIGLSLSVALLGLVRPPDLVLALVPLFWQAKQYGGIIGKLRFLFKEHRNIVLVAIAPAVFLFLLQIAYWKIVTGHFLVNSYRNPGEGFDWTDPHLFQLLFSYRKGWFLYTPLMLFALAGCVLWARSRRSGGNVSLTALVIFIYAVSTWTTWWYAASFGQRAVVDAYPILAVGLGFFLLWAKGVKLYVMKTLLICCFVALNLFQGWQMEHGILDLSQMTRKYYWSVFGQTEPPSAQQKALLLPFEDINKRWSVTDEKEYVRYFVKEIPYPQPSLIERGVEYGPSQDISPEELGNDELIWLKAVWKYDPAVSDPEGKVFAWHIKHKGEVYAWKGGAAADSSVVNDTVRHTLTAAYFLPHLRSRLDVINTGIWHQDQSHGALKITGLRIEAWRLRDRRRYE